MLLDDLSSAFHWGQRCMLEVEGAVLQSITPFLYQTVQASTKQRPQLYYATFGSDSTRLGTPENHKANKWQRTSKVPKPRNLRWVWSSCTCRSWQCEFTFAKLIARSLAIESIEAESIWEHRSYDVILGHKVCHTVQQCPSAAGSSEEDPSLKEMVCDNTNPTPGKCWKYLKCYTYIIFSHLISSDIIIYVLISSYIILYRLISSYIILYVLISSYIILCLLTWSYIFLYLLVNAS